MKKKIKLICILIIFLIIIGITLILSRKYYKTTTGSEILENESDLVKLDISSLGDISVQSLDTYNKYTVINYTNFIGEDVGTGDIDETDLPEIHYYISIFDINSNKCIKTVEYENEGYPYMVYAENDKIELKSDISENEIIFDYNLNELERTTYEYEESWEKIETIDTNRFYTKFNYAENDSSNYSTLLFLDDPNEFYTINNANHDEFKQTLEHKILAFNTSKNENGNDDNVLKIIDFDNNLMVNTITVTNNLDYNNISCTNFNDNYATYSTTYDIGNTQDIYVWKYNVNKKNKSLGDSYCTKINSNDIDSKIEEICNNLKEKYDITVSCGESESFFDYEVSNDFKPILFYQYMIELENDLSYFPKEFYKEILCSDIDNPTTQFDEFRIYMIGHIDDGSADAFASNAVISDPLSSDTSSDEKSIVYIVYSLTGFTTDTFFHEIMHIIEYRIWNYDKNFDDEWTKLNPTKFEYNYENYGDIFLNNEAWQEYFIRDYGMKTMLEDRATCFAALCNAALGGNSWWKEKAELVKKEQFLTSIIQKSFPSLNQNPIWSNEI